MPREESPHLRTEVSATRGRRPSKGWDRGLLWRPGPTRIRSRPRNQRTDQEEDRRGEIDQGGPRRGPRPDRGAAMSAPEQPPQGPSPQPAPPSGYAGPEPAWQPPARRPWNGFA